MQATQVQNHLVSVQPQFKSELLSGVAQFKISVDQFVDDYNEKYVHVNRKIITSNFEHVQLILKKPDVSALYYSAGRFRNEIQVCRTLKTGLRRSLAALVLPPGNSVRLECQTDTGQRDTKLLL